MDSRALQASIAFQLLAGAGCCLASSGTSTTTSTSVSGGSSTGRPITFDSGTCLIDGGLVKAGTWFDLQYGSCTVCNPRANPNGWTPLDAGEVCEAMATNSQTNLPALTIPVTGRCSLAYPPSSSACAANGAGLPCGVDVGCGGGFCNDAGLCEVNQNLSWFDTCRGLGVLFNACAEGPCCMDAGYAIGIPDGGGWCCGLIDGGVKTCLPSGAVCYDSSNCCEGLTCVGHDAVYESDAGYGFCVPD